MAIPTADDNTDDDCEFVADLTFNGNDAVLRLAGQLDIANADRVRELVDEALQHGPAQLVYDLADVEFMDSSVLAALLHGAHQTGSARVRRPSPSALRLIRATGLGDVLPVEP